MIRERLGIGMAATLITIWLGLAIWAAATDSPVNDEISDLQVGERLWRTGAGDLIDDHPPFPRLWTTLPWRILQPKMPTFSPPPPESWIPLRRLYATYAARYAHGLDLFYRSGNSPDALLLSTRMMAILPMAACGWLVFHWARRWYGLPGGLVAVGLFAGHPLLLGHGHIAKYDGLTAVMVTAAVWTFLRWCEAGGWERCLAMGLSLGIALSSKPSAALLLPVFLPAAVLFARRLASRHGEQAAGGRPRARFLREGLTGALIAWLVIAVLYGFRGPFLNRPIVPELVAAGRPPALIESLYRWMPVPDGYARAFLYTAGRVHAGEFAIPFSGEMYAAPRWWMVPWAVMVKTPVGFLAVGGLLLASFRRRRPDAREMTLLGVTGLLLVTTSLSTLFNGSRYLVPGIPLLCVLAARAWLRRTDGRTDGRSLSLVVAVTAGIAESWIRAPYFIAFANLLVGGPAHAPFRTATADLDYGQDLRRLAQLVQPRPPGALMLSYFGTAPPDAFGLAYQDAGSVEVALRYYQPRVAPAAARPEWFAVSVNHLIQLQGRRGWQWLKDSRPVARAGETIWIYDISRSAPAHHALAALYLTGHWKEAFVREAGRIRDLDGPGSIRLESLEAACRWTGRPDWARVVRGLRRP